MNSPIGVIELIHLPGLFEPVSAISHLFALGLFVWLGAMLVQRAGDNQVLRRLLLVYVAAIVIQFAVSTVYHMTVLGTSARQTLKQLDHSAIFILIAGTFTPALGLLYSGKVRWVGLIGVWAGALIGVLLATLGSGRLAEGAYLILYLALGWSGLIAIYDLWRRFGTAFVAPMLIGGSINSLAGVAQFFGWPIILPGVVHAHEFFHIVVIVGSVLQYCFIWQVADAGGVRPEA